jgi:hypothetical protein
MIAFLIIAAYILGYLISIAVWRWAYPHATEWDIASAITIAILWPLLVAAAPLALLVFGALRAGDWLARHR